MDPSDLAEQISEDLAPTEIPADLSTLSDDEVSELLSTVALDVAYTQRLAEQKRRKNFSERARAILRIKRSKLKRVFKEHNVRAALELPPNLSSLSYEHLHALHIRLVAEQRRIKNLQRPGNNPDQVAAAKILIELRKDSLILVQKEFGRRKKEERDLDRFLVREASVDADLLEQYINETRDGHPHWWPHSFVAVGDRMLVVWRTKEAE